MNKRALLFITAMLVLAPPLAHRAWTQMPLSDPLRHEQGRHEMGLGELTKDREAAHLFKLAADRGDADAQVNLGLFYTQGRGGLQKKTTARPRVASSSRRTKETPKGNTTSGSSTSRVAADCKRMSVRLPVSTNSPPTKEMPTLSSIWGFSMRRVVDC